MKKFLKLLTLILVLSAISFSCKQEENYPKEISYTQFSLSGISSQWKNLPYDNKVIIINNSDELRKYVADNENITLDIDFSKRSLLLASGKTDKGIAYVSVQELQQLSTKKYKLSVDVTFNDAITAESFCVAILVDKVSEKSSVELEVNKNEVIIKSCGIVYVNDDEYIKMCAVPDIVSIDDVAFSVILENHTHEVYIYGNPFWVEYFEGSVWKRLDLDMNFHFIAYFLQPEEKVEQTIDLNEFHLLEGKYRIVKDVNLDETPLIRFNLFAEFLITKNE